MTAFVLHGDPLIDSYTGLRWCLRGLHLMTEENVSVGRDGIRRCRPCIRLNKRIRRQRQARERARAARTSTKQIVAIASGSHASEGDHPAPSGGHLAS